MLQVLRTLFGHKASQVRQGGNRSASPRTRLGVEALEQRDLMAALTFTAPSTGPNDIVLQSSNGYLQVSNNGSLVAQQAIASTTSVSLTGGTSSTNTFTNTFEIYSTALNVPTTVNFKTAFDSAYVGMNAGNGLGPTLSGIQGTLSIYGYNGNGTVNVNDTGDLSLHSNVTISSAGITGLAPAAINYSGVGYLNVYGSSYSGGSSYSITGDGVTSGGILSLHLNGSYNHVNVSQDWGSVAIYGGPTDYVQLGYYVGDYQSFTANSSYADLNCTCYNDYVSGGCDVTTYVMSGGSFGW
jgi:hypothetical protein